MNKDGLVESRVRWGWVVCSVCAVVPACATAASRPGGEQSVSAASDAAVETQQASGSVESGPLFGGGPTTSHATTSSSAAPTTSDAPPIPACARAVAIGAEPTIDDFEDGDQETPKRDGRDGSWYFYDDGTRGTSSVNFGVDESGERSGRVLSVAGSGFSDWGSGFGVGFNWNEGQCTYDASVYDGVRFWVRGFGQARLTLQNLSVRPVSVGGQCPVDAACFDSHGVTFEIPEAWTRLQFDLADFEQAGWGTPVGPLRSDAVYLMEFQFGAVQPFAIALDDVTFFRRTDAADAGNLDGGTTGHETSGDERSGGAGTGDGGTGGSGEAASSASVPLDAGGGEHGETVLARDGGGEREGRVDAGETSGRSGGPQP